MIKYDIPPGMALQSSTSIEYYGALMSEFRLTPIPICASQQSGAVPPEKSNGVPGVHQIWRMLDRLIYGQKSPFDRVGDTMVDGEIAERRIGLPPPLGHPEEEEESLYCDPPTGETGYLKIIRDLFGKTIPVPVGGR